MANNIDIRNAEQFSRFGKALKQAGETDLRKELTAGIRKGAKPLVPKAKAAARAKLPKAGGLNDLVAKEPYRIAVKTGRTPGVSIVVGKKRGGAQATNRGVVRHPVYGNKSVYVNQPVPQAEGWFDDEMTKEAPSVLPDIEQAVQRVIDEVVRRGR